MKGEFEVFLYNRDGELIEYREVKNTTVDAGFSAVCAMMGQGSIVPFTYCAIGTGTTEPDNEDTALESESARVQGGYTLVSAKVWTNVSTFGAGVGTGAITESGLLNASSNGTLLCRQTFAVVNKGADDSMIVTWQYTLS